MDALFEVFSGVFETVEMGKPVENKFKIGDIAPTEKVTTIEDQEILLKGGNGIIHFQLRRFSGCPICNVHLKSIASHYSEIQACGVKEVIVLHSSADIIKENQGSVEWAKELTFIADPTKALYKSFGATQSGIMSLLSAATLKAVFNGKAITKLFKREGAEAGKNQNPMEALIDTATGEIIDIHYGKSFYDQWSVEELMTKIKKG